MKKSYYFLIAVFMMLTSFTSCKLDYEKDLDLYSAEAEGTVLTDTVKITIYLHGDCFIVGPIPGDKDTVIVTSGNDTIYWYVDTTKTTPVEPTVTYTYYLGTDKVDGGSDYYDLQPTSRITSNGEVDMSTKVMRTAELKERGTLTYAPKVSNLTATVGYPASASESDVLGEYNITRNRKDYVVRVNDGTEYDLTTVAEAASGIRDGKVVDLLSRQVSTVSVISIEDVATGDSTTENGKVYAEKSRTVKALVRQKNRPLMGVEVITDDTLSLTSMVYVEDGVIPSDTVPTDTIPVTPPDTIPVTPPDTIPVTPDTPDDGYTINGEKIVSIVAGYTPNPQTKKLSRCLLVRTEHYAMPVVDKKMQAPVNVPDPNDYNSVTWYGGAWVPATLEITNDDFTWSVNGVVTANPTTTTINLIAEKTGISSISSSDFIRNASFVNEGQTTHVYIGGQYYMTLK
jgi:hypothetical protein